MATPAGKPKVVRIELSPEQAQQLRDATGIDVKAIELAVEELEQRVAPRLATNHNETLLVP